MREVEVVSLSTVCQSFPDVKGPLIRRENLLDAIDTILEGTIKLVVVEGKEGVGKTSLLSAFALEHPFTAFSVFLKQESRWGYDPGTVQIDLCNQMYWLINQEETNLTEADDALMGRLYLQLQKNARRTKETYFFIIDGLDEIPKADYQIREHILTMLPWHVKEFKFILSGDLNTLPDRICKTMECKSFPLPGFSLSETMEYLKDLNLDERAVREIYRAYSAIPAYLSSIRRIIEFGVTVEALLEEIPEGLLDLFAIEWRAVDQSNQLLMSVIGVLTFGQIRPSLNNFLLVNPRLCRGTPGV